MPRNSQLSTLIKLLYFDIESGLFLKYHNPVQAFKHQHRIIQLSFWRMDALVSEGEMSTGYRLLSTAPRLPSSVKQCAADPPT